MNTERIDVRKLSAPAREQMRKIVLRLHAQGYGSTAIAQMLGLRRPTVSEWLARVRKGLGTAERKRGRRVGTGRRLTEAQEARILKEVTTHTPDQLGLPYALWTAQAVRDLIHRYFAILLPKRTVRLYLQRWGLTTQRPIKRALERDPAKVRHWLEEMYPRIQAKAREEKAQLLFGDETGVNSLEHHPKGYAPKGKPPVLVLPQSQRHRLNVISAISPQGQVRFMLYPDTLKAEIFLDFLKRLVKDSDRKIFLVLDNHKVHHSRKVQQWVADHHQQIELFFLPPYSPDLNPDEYLNAELKARLHAGEPVKDADHLKRKLMAHLRSIQRQPEKVKSYFQAESICYAAA